MTIVAISGGFDPIHRGHVNMIEEAAQYGRLHVYLNTDAWLMRKKGYVFMPFEDRARILMAMKGVELVIPVVDEDDTVCETIRMFKPDIFCNGGDRLPENTPELRLCCDLGIQMKFNVGGEKIQSSSELVRKSKNQYLDVYECEEDGMQYLHFATAPMTNYKVFQRITNPGVIKYSSAPAFGFKHLGTEKELGLRK